MGQNSKKQSRIPKLVLTGIQALPIWKTMAERIAVSIPVYKGIDVHAGPDAGKEQYIPFVYLMSGEFPSEDHIIEGWNGRDGTVAQFMDAHGHDIFWDGSVMDTIKSLYYRLVHLFIGLMDEYLFDLVDVHPTFFQAGSHGLGDI